jgi:hypothetical protein
MMSNNFSGTSKARNLDMRPLRIMVAVVAFMWAFAPALRAAQPVRHLRPADRAVLVGDVSVPVEHYRHLPASRLTGWDFMLQADSLGFWPLDSAIVSEVLAGNVPQAMRSFRKVVIHTAVTDSVPALAEPHTIELLVLPDYVMIGTDEDYVRMPMSPLAAQAIARELDCSLPTAYIVDRINDVAEGRLDIFAFRPRGNRNSDPIVYQDHNHVLMRMFEMRGYRLGQFISGLKKDIIQTCWRHLSPQYPHEVVIYGWHHPDGHPQQPMFLRHADYYADYSHGVRLVSNHVLVDGVHYNLPDLLRHPVLYALLSDEPHPLSDSHDRLDKQHHNGNGD